MKNKREIRVITASERIEFNKVVSHPLQSYEWGEFRQNSGIKVIRRGFFEKRKLVKAFTLTIHKIPKTLFNIGYLPKGNLPDQELLEELQKIGKQENCIFIQLEPNIIQNSKFKIQNLIHPSPLVIPASKLVIPAKAGIQTPRIKLVPAAHPLFTKYTFVLDLTKSEDELLKAMHPKARYNIKVARKHGVEIIENNSEDSFEEYWRLMEETTKRQGFYAHTKKYHRMMWRTLNAENSNIKYRSSKQIQNTNNKNSKRLENLNLEHSNIVSNFGFRASDLKHLTAHLFTAKYKNKILTTWILFIFKDTLYYPYGASSNENREVMASNLIMWEAIHFGKKLGLKKFDMWGSLGPNPELKDPWFGFHNFKQKYGPEHIEFIGSYDLVINPMLYEVYKLADKLRWIYLKLKK